MSDQCAQWVALSDRRALGDALSPEETTFLARHAASCPACSAEALVWSDLAGLVNRSVHAPSAPHEVPADSAGELDLPAAAVAARRRGAWALVALAACAALALAAPLLRGPRSQRSAPSAALTRPLPEKTAPAVRVVLISGGELEVDGRPAQAGAEIALGSLVFARSGSGCLALEPGVRACFAQSSLLRVAELSESSRRLELRAGKLAASLDPQSPGQSFGIVTREGVAIAIGTAFSVEVPAEGGPVMTRVMHGTVLVRGATGAEQRVGALRVASMRGGASALSARDAAEERPLFAQTELCALARTASAPQAAPGHLRVTSRPAGALVRIDERPVGVTPLALMLGTGEHELVVSQPGGSRWREVVRVAADQQLARSFEDAPREAAPRPVAVLSRGAARELRNAQERVVPSPSDLLSAARERRAAQDREGARRVYEELFKRHGESSEALAARVAYGEMLLGEGRDAAVALASFERYLARGGPLVREASFGRVRALRALGKQAEERAALDAFLRDFPDGPLADALRARQRTLSQR